MSAMLPRLHRLFLGHMLSSIAVVQTLQQRRLGPIDSVADVLSRMGGRSVYMYTIPAVMWLGDAVAARKLFAAWAFGCMRDMLWLPRLDQLTADVAVLKLDGHTEFGFPCVKSYSATVFPVMLSMLCWQQDGSSLLFGLLLSSCWVFSVLASRVYLGVASFASVAAGAVIALGTSGLWLMIGDSLEHHMQQHPLWFALAQPFGCVLALLAYPIPWRHTTTFQTAAGVLGMVSGFLFGSSLASAGLLPSSLNVQLAPVTFDSGVLLLALMSLSRLFVGVVTLVLVKLAVEKLAKQALSTISWFVPRLSPSFLPILSCVYGYDELAYPMLSLWSDRPCTLKVRLDVDGASPSHAVIAGQHHVTTNGASPPDAMSKFRKRKPSKGTDMLPHSIVAASGPARKADVPEVHDGCPSTWFGIPLGYAFTRMAKAATSGMALLGPFAALVPNATNTGGVPFDVDVVPNEQHQATVSGLVGMLTADAKRHCRIVPVAVLSHFAAGLASVVLAPSFMFAQAV